MATNLDVAKRLATAKGTFATAYDAGHDAGLRGPDTNNCHFGYFRSKESTADWERGNRDGKSAAPPPVVEPSA
jgi:hypothetical protein